MSRFPNHHHRIVEHLFHELRALDEIHALQLVHLDLKADNICIPIAPADFDPCVAGQLLWPKFEELGVLEFESMQHDGAIDWAVLEAPLETKSRVAA